MLKREARQRNLSRLMLLSVLVHLGLLFLLGRAGTFEFAPPVAAGKTVTIELQQAGQGGKDSRDWPAGRRGAGGQGRPVATSARQGAATAGEDSSSGPAAAAKDPEQETAPVEGGKPLAAAAEERSKPATELPVAKEPPAAQVIPPAAKAGSKLKMPPPLRSGAEFVTATSERLTYRVTLRGLPIGEAVLAAVRGDARLRITAKLRSSPLVETFYNVDDTVESELVAGNYLVTAIRQHEGDYSRNAGFTIMIREQKAFSTDRLQGRFVTDPLPNTAVTDPITGFYFLRNQPMKEGKTLLLHLYDSGGYAATSVEVLRQERIWISGLGEVKTLVLRPHLRPSGLFRRTGDVLIWLTDDEFRVPVRMKASIALGEVTAEIVSSEIER